MGSLFENDEHALTPHYHGTINKEEIVTKIEVAGYYADKYEKEADIMFKRVREALTEKYGNAREEKIVEELKMKARYSIIQDKRKIEVSYFRGLQDGWEISVEYIDTDLENARHEAVQRRKKSGGF